MPSCAKSARLVVSLGPEFRSVVLALALVYTPVVARLVRGTTLVIRELPYVEAARCIGLSDRTILRHYVLANAVSPLIVQCTFIAAYAILAEASLSFLGASINPETPNLGQHAPRRPTVIKHRLVDGRRRPLCRPVLHGACLYVVWGYVA